MIIYESYISLEQMISELKKHGKNYDYRRFSKSQIYAMYTKYCNNNSSVHTKKEDEITNAVVCTCDNCGTILTDSGECPVCDYGETPVNEAVKNNKQIKIEINKIMSAYCGYRRPKEISELWDKLYQEYNIEPLFTSSNYVGQSADGTEQWICDCEYGRIVYSVYEPEQGSKNDYNIYIA